MMHILVICLEDFVFFFFNLPILLFAFLDDVARSLFFFAPLMIRASIVDVRVRQGLKQRLAA